MSNKQPVFAYQVKEELQRQLYHNFYRLPSEDALLSFLTSDGMLNGYLDQRIKNIGWFFNSSINAGKAKLKDERDSIAREDLIDFGVFYLLENDTRKKENAKDFVARLRESNRRPTAPRKTTVNETDTDNSTISRLGLTDTTGQYQLSVKYKKDNLYFIIENKFSTEDTSKAKPTVFRLDHLKGQAFVTTALKAIRQRTVTGPAFEYLRDNEEDGSTLIRARVARSMFTPYLAVDVNDLPLFTFEFGEDTDNSDVRDAVAEEWLKKIRIAMTD